MSFCFVLASLKTRLRTTHCKGIPEIKRDKQLGATSAASPPQPMRPVWEEDNSPGASLPNHCAILRSIAMDGCQRASRGGKAHGCMGPVPEELFPTPSTTLGVAGCCTVILLHDPPPKWTPWISVATGICLLTLTAPTARPPQPQRPQPWKPRARRAWWPCYRGTSFLRKTQSAWAGDSKRCYTHSLKYQHCNPEKKILPLPKPLGNVFLQCCTEVNVLCFPWTVNLLIFSFSALSNYCSFFTFEDCYPPTPVGLLCSWPFPGLILPRALLLSKGKSCTASVTTRSPEITLKHF